MLTPGVQCPRLNGAREDYEALRRAALEGGGPRELGFALLRRSGMAAWIRAWSACDGPPRATRDRAAAGPPLPEGVRGDVTRLLVTMALGADAEARRCGHDSR